MFYFRLLLLLIHIDQETVLNWFGIKDQNSQWSFSPIVENDYSLSQVLKCLQPCFFRNIEINWKLLG
jgi:hypothetical protein